jgi:hypothetical protein
MSNVTLVPFDCHASLFGYFDVPPLVDYDGYLLAMGICL